MKQANNAPKVVKKLRSGTVILKETTKHGMRQLRCPGCHNLAGINRRPDGTSVTQCGHCGRSFVMQKM